MKAESEKRDLEILCDQIRNDFSKIRHAGYHDALGKTLYNSVREGLVQLEGEEERHILNGTVASTLKVWKNPDRLLGLAHAFIMIRERVIVLIIPLKSGNYLLAGFDPDTRMEYVEKVRFTIMKKLRILGEER